jgi:hypothetical protein
MNARLSVFGNQQHTGGIPVEAMHQLKETRFRTQRT